MANQKIGLVVEAPFLIIKLVSNAFLIVLLVLLVLLWVNGLSETCRVIAQDAATPSNVFSPT